MGQTMTGMLNRQPGKTAAGANLDGAPYGFKVTGDAAPGPWTHMCLGSEGCLVIRKHGTIRDRGRGRVALFGCKDHRPDHADAQFVATMNPAVAAHLAATLEELAEHADRGSQGALVAGGLDIARAITGTGTGQ